MVRGEGFAGVLRSKMVRKKKARKDVKHSSTRAPEQMSLPEAERQAWSEKVAWRGGILAKRDEEDDD